MSPASRWLLRQTPDLTQFRHILARLLCASLFTLVALEGVASAQTHIEGRVLDSQGQPVAGAYVIAISLTSAPAATVSDNTGRFRVDGLAEGRYDLTASAPGLYGELRGVTVGASANESLEITMRISALTESLVVSATQSDQPLSRIADSVTVISGQDLESRQIVALGDALRTVPGFTVARNGGPGALTSVFPRGGESDYTLVLVDGISANTFGGSLDFSQVPLADVDRIEVVRGPQSAVFGGHALGGVVHVISRQSGPPSAAGLIEGGSWNGRRAIGSTTGEIQNWRWLAGGDYSHHDGFTGVAANGEQVSNDDARERQGWVGAGWRGSRGTDVRGVFRYVDTDRGAPGPYGSDPANRFFGVDRVSRSTTERHSVGFAMVHPWTGPASRVRQRIEFDVADYDLRFVSIFDPTRPSESDTRRSHGRVQTDAVLDAGVGISAGVEWLNERARSTFITAGVNQVPIDRRVIGTFGEARWNAHERFTLQAGLRVEHILRKQLDADPLGFTPRPEFDDDDVVSVNPKVSAAWLVTPSLPSTGASAWTRLHLAAGTGIRPPDAFEIAFTDNPGLKPERSRSLEAGLTQALSGGAIQLDVTGFFNQYDDLIVSVGSLQDVSRYRTDNVSNARARGLELSAAARAQLVGVRGMYTFLDTAILAIDRLAQAPSPYQVGDPLLRRPRHQGSLTVDWTIPRASMFAELHTRGATLDAEPAFGPSGGLYENPGRTIVDIGGSFRVVQGVEVFARILNLFDRSYEDVLGYPAPRRTAFAGVRLAARR
jgi:outer membrane cobalamin receptor